MSIEKVIEEHDDYVLKEHFELVPFFNPITIYIPLKIFSQTQMKDGNLMVHYIYRQEKFNGWK